VEFTTEIEFTSPQTLSNELIVGNFGLLGSLASWALPAGTTSREISQVPDPLFVASGTVDVHTDHSGLRYVVHLPSTGPSYLAAKPVPGGIEVGLLASIPASACDMQNLDVRTGLGFPGSTYLGKYTYRYALLPLSSDKDAITHAYSHPIKWIYVPRSGSPETFDPEHS
jgi:hypothetical protein